MKIFVFLMLFILSIAQSHASRDCRNALTQNNYQDSFSMSLDIDQINDRYFGKDYVAAAIHYVKIVLEKKGCSRADVNFGRGPLGRSKTRCQFLAKGVASSLSCYVESNLGFFFVNRDLLNKVHVMYSRWD